MSHDRDERGARLEAYLAGALDETERAAFEAEALADPELADQLYAAEGLDAALRGAISAETAAVVRPPASSWRRRLWLAALPAAAVVTFLILMPRNGLDSSLPTASTPVLRGDEAPTRGLTPRGELTAAPDRFVWTSAAGAVRYRLELFDGGGRLLLTRVVGDTVFVVPPTVPVAVADGDEPYWRVLPIAADGRELPASAPVRFRLSPP